MSTNEHPITPPPELVQQWTHEATEAGMVDEEIFATHVARWGADQELEACVEWVADTFSTGFSEELRATRRPKSPSLKEEALTDLDVIYTNQPTTAFDDHFDRVRRALESLPND
jgi:hypothetical protein